MKGNLIAVFGGELLVFLYWGISDISERILMTVFLAIIGGVFGMVGKWIAEAGKNYIKLKIKS